MINKFKEYVQKTDSLAIFLILEMVAFAGFALGNANLIFRYLGFAVALLLIPYAILFINKKDILTILVFAIPLVGFIAIMSLSNFQRSAYAWYENLSIGLGFVSFFFLGVMLRKIKTAKPEIILLVIGASIGLLCLISTLITVFQYGPFYAAINNDKFYFYNGELFPVFNEARFLYGFTSQKVSLSYYGLYGTLLASTLCALPFVSIKKNEKMFYVLLLIGAIGLLSILLVPYWQGLLYLIPALAFSLLFKFLRWSKPAKITAIVAFGLFALLLFSFFILAFINASSTTGLTDIIKNNALLNKLFNNESVMKPINTVLYSMTYVQNLFGFDLSNLNYAAKSAISQRTGIVEIEILKEGGLLALSALLLVIGVAIYAAIKYVRHSQDQDHIKAIIISFLITFLVYETFFGYDCEPLVHETYYFQFIEQMPILIVILLLGYIILPNRGNNSEDVWISVKEENKKEEKEGVSL